VVTELFPFGRRQLAGEYTALLEAAHARSPRPAVLASIRDILNPPAKASRADEALARLGAYYDGVLVHGDEAHVPLSASWPVAPALERRLIYTGYIAEAAMPLPGDETGDGEVVVSGGGSAASLPVYEAALGAASILGADHAPGSLLPWRVLVGHGVPAADFDRLASLAPPHVTVERARADFRDLLARCAVSVSQAGYNTMVELAQARARSVVVPFQAGREEEQALRAACFERAGLISVVPEASLSAEALASAVRERLQHPRPDRSAMSVDGLAHSIRAIEAAATDRGRWETATARLKAALDDLARAGITWPIWWRDDDAVESSPALDRLIDLAAKHSAPFSLAVVPAGATQGLAARIAGAQNVDILQHGWSHTNHAPAGEKKCELRDDAPGIEDRLVEGRIRLGTLFGERLLPVLVPPWNRIDAALVTNLASLGFAGLSTFKPRSATFAAQGLVQINTHWDPIAWKNGGGLRDPGALIDELAAYAEAILAGSPDSHEPYGLLTHHLVHDGWTWRLLDDVLQILANHKAVRIIGARKAFDVSRQDQEN
jgi:predicted glycosyltransferase